MAVTPPHDLSLASHATHVDAQRLDGGADASLLEVMRTVEHFVEEQLSLLKPVEESWQPTDFLPDATRDTWYDEIAQCRQQAQGLSDEVLVVLVGDMVTEEALPSYQTWLNRVAGLTDATGASRNPWAQWTRGWTAEENRHGDLLNRYLYLSGRVEMRAVERTTQHLLRNGFNPDIGRDPYQGLIYTSFQERGTKISHRNVARLAQAGGDTTLGNICNAIAGDEARHEEAYKRFVGRLFETDPNGAVRAFAAMMRTRVVMPARLMADGEAKDLFGQFASVAERIGAYTLHDYAENIAHLVDYWKIPALTGLRGEAGAAQEYLGGLAQRHARLAERAAARQAEHQKAAFSWIFGRSV